MRGSCSSLVLKSSDDAALQGASKYILREHRNNASISQYTYVSPWSVAGSCTSWSLPGAVVD